MLTAAGCTSADRSGLAVSLDKAAIVEHHSRTRAFNGCDLKAVSPAEADRTVRLSPTPQPVVAQLSDGYLIMRKHPPSLLDVITKGFDAQYQVAQHGPGDQGIDGYLWDFEAPHSKDLVKFSAEIIAACSARRGDAPRYPLPYAIHPVRGDPYREGNKLVNTRFGDITTTTVADSDDPWLLTTAVCKGNVAPVVTDGKQIATTQPLGGEIYIPTLPKSVLDYLDGREDCPTYFTMHGTEIGALADLSKFNLSTQGFILPGVLTLVRNYIIRKIGYRPPIHTPATVPSNDSHAGINGLRFSTKMLQALPDINEICDRAAKEVWQSVTPVTLKKQFCSKWKTRTILGTNALISLAIRAGLSGVTQAFQLAGKDSPICLGKSKFNPMQVYPEGVCMETDLASCDRSTPAVVRWFTTELLFEIGCCSHLKPLYIANCCHDLLVTQTTACTKRGGLSSGDPVTSISNTIYSLILYAQHMVLSALREGHKIALSYIEGKLTLEDLIAVQPFVVYSDDLVLIKEAHDLPNFKYWNAHLDLALGFKTDPSKTVVTTKPNFLGCTFYGPWLVPCKDRVLAALAYHMGAKDAEQYYQNAVAILNDASALSVFEPEWFEELVLGLAECARKDGYTFPGPATFRDFYTRVSGYKLEGKNEVCSICMSTATTTSNCGLSLCSYCAHRHIHPNCSVKSPFCDHPIASKSCACCSIDMVPSKDDFSQLLQDHPYDDIQFVNVNVIDGIADAAPGRYTCQKKYIVLRREPQGCPVDLPDGAYTMKKLPSTCSGIIVPKAIKNAAISTFIVGPPGSGKTTAVSKLLTDDSVVYCPTHASLIAYSKSLPAARFVIPKNQDESLYGTPSDSGPTLRLLSCGYIPAAQAFVDEACYANPFDLLKILTHTPITAIGDPYQLKPVGFEKVNFIFNLMKRQQLNVIYRFGPNITEAISHLYHDRLVTQKTTPTEVIYQTKFQPRGLVLTPYHRDRIGDAITIDSAQGMTRPIVTVYLPSRKSLTAPRALVAITRATDRLYIYDPHEQLSEFFKLPPCSLGMKPHAFVVDGKVLVRINDKVTASALDFPGLLVTANPRTPEDKQTLLNSPLNVDCLESGALSPLPRVAHNLGFYFSPDIPHFYKLPEQLAPHWPVVTNKNRSDWPNRLVVSVTQLSPLSQRATCAGYYVGDSLFLGVPGVVSYWMTQFLDGKAVPIEPSLFSTGRFELDVRSYLDEKEREFALSHPHAFIGDTKGTTVGGCHHITSCYLPRELPRDAVVKVGVSAPGKAHKSCCTVTDIYLPFLADYTTPSTQSKVYKVNIDNKSCRLMVWRDATMYFQESYNPLALVEAATRLGGVSGKGLVYLGEDVTPAVCNRRFTFKAQEPSDLGVTKWDSNSKLLVSTSYPDDMSDNWLLLNAVTYMEENLLGTSRTFVYFYKQLAEPHAYGQFPINEKVALARIPRYNLHVSTANFHFSPTACGCTVSLTDTFGKRVCDCSWSEKDFIKQCELLHKPTCTSTCAP
uniref:Replicase polyprotein 1ab n=1 Tax=Simian hemorrhagic fever virus TaxID=38143 RepID=L0CQA4_SHFV|nr:ORF1b [Simian hemorrhagic fever virus]